MKTRRWAGVPAVAAIAATYAYFLLFDQFALLDLLQALGDPAATQAAMAAMGLTGLGSSLVLAWLLGKTAEPAALARRFLLAGYAAGAVAAAAAALAPAGAGVFLSAVALLAGLATALVTVPLAAALRELLASPAERAPAFGRLIGLGTGLAYLFCNLPPVFAGSPNARSAIAAGVVLLGWLAAWRLQPGPAAPEAAGPALGPRDLRAFGLAGLLLSFLALVWLDSAAFAVIQENAALKALTWSGSGATLLLGGIHFLAALAAGRLIDAGFFRSLLLGAFALFAAALGLLGAEPAGALRLAGPLYAAAVSLYSVALVAFPAYGAEAYGWAARRWRAGLVFGVAGWLGSALGVGMAQDLHRVPWPFLLAAGSLLAIAAWLGRGPRRLAAGRLLAASWLPAFLFAAAGIVHFTAAPPDAAAAGAASPADAAARGRLVYIAEGCIYCHSQYVRPGTPDESLWGPHRPLDRERERPPLIGLRRQGPDLSNVGRRRDAAALELQLRAPRSVAPASAMPSYTHLFAPGDRRGRDLVAYLESLR